MGASIINLQVWTQGNTEETLRKSITDILKNKIIGQGFQLAEAHEKSSWSVAIAYAPKTSWVGVYENGLASQLDPSFLEEMAVIFSRELATNALVNMVCDSDVLVMQLFQNGKKLETYHSCPDYFEEQISEDQLSHMQRLSACWEHMLAKGYVIDDLTRVWEEQAVFAEVTLAAVAECIGINSEQSVMGFEDLQDSEECQVTYLRFKK
ncbi:MAG: hypothetical protein ACRCTE_08990 [Cellulosilyticaceae bacterium]